MSWNVPQINKCLQLQAGGQRPPDGHRMKLDNRGEPYHDKQRPSGSYNAHPNASRYDPARVKLEPGHHGSYFFVMPLLKTIPKIIHDQHDWNKRVEICQFKCSFQCTMIKSESMTCIPAGTRPDHHNIKREPGYHDKREPGYHDHKRDPNLHNVKLENPSSRHPHALAPQVSLIFDNHGIIS